MGQQWPLFHLFLVFSTKHYNFYNNYMWKNVHPVYGAVIRTHERESLPITTRPGLPPKKYILFKHKIFVLFFAFKSAYSSSFS